MALTADTPPLLRVRPVPAREPGGALGVLPALRDQAPARQLPLPFEPVPPAPSRSVGARQAARDTAPADPREWALRFSQVALEVATGLRPAAQLVRWATPAVVTSLGHLHALAQRGGGRPARVTVRSVRLSEPVPGVGEVAAVVTAGPRVRALAFRMEADGGRWRVVAFELG